MSIVSPRKLPSERRFGLMLAAAFAILAAYQVFRHRSWFVSGACLIAAVAFGLFALLLPQALAPLNKAWFYFGELLGKIVSPVVLGIIFFVILTPIAIVTRLFGRDELRLKRRRANSYWIDRAPSPTSAAQSFRNQF